VLRVGNSHHYHCRILADGCEAEGLGANGIKNKTVAD